MIEEPGLSDRELEILKLIATGASNKEIGTSLSISPNTVKVHIANIFSKIGVVSRTEAAMYAVRIGLVQTSLNDVQKTDTITIDENRFNSKIIWPSIFLVLIFIILSVGIGGYIIRSRMIKFAIPPTNLPNSTTSWKLLAPMVEPRSNFAYAINGNSIYVIGGIAKDGVTDSVESYNIANNSWSKRQSKPLAVSEVGAVLIGGKIYVPGGRKADGKITDVVEIYDPGLDKWSEGPKLPKGICGYSSLAIEGELTLFGGWDGKNYLNSVYIYNPSASNGWIELGSINNARAYAGVAFIDGKIYLIGGQGETGALTDNDVMTYGSIITNNMSLKWEKSTAMPTNRYKMGLTSIANMIYIVGGLGISGQPLQAMRYIPQDNQWQSLETPISGAWEGLGLISNSTNLFVLGGKMGDVISNKMYTYQAVYTIALPVIR